MTPPYFQDAAASRSERCSAALLVSFRPASTVAHCPCSSFLHSRHVLRLAVDSNPPPPAGIQTAKMRDRSPSFFVIIASHATLGSKPRRAHTRRSSAPGLAKKIARFTTRRAAADLWRSTLPSSRSSRDARPRSSRSRDSSRSAVESAGGVQAHQGFRFECASPPTGPTPSSALEVTSPVGSMRCYLGFANERYDQ